jgi:hypothetical protein
METYSTNITTCTEDIDCSPYYTNRLCVAGAQWLRTNEPECQCNYFYGFVPSEPGGVVCDQHSTGSYLSMVMYAGFTIFNVIQLYLCAVFLARSFRGTKYHLRRGRSSTRVRTVQSMLLNWRGMSAVQATTVFMMVSIACACGVATFTFLNFAVVEGVPPAFAISGKDGFGRYEIYTRTLLMLCGLFGQLGAFNLCIAWMEVAVEADTIVGRKRKLRKARRLALAVEIFIILSCFAGAIFESRTGIQVMALLGAAFQPAAITAQAGMYDLCSTCVNIYILSI